MVLFDCFVLNNNYFFNKMFRSVKTITYNSLKSLLKVRSCECSRVTIHDLGLDIPKITLTDIRKLLRQKGFAVQDGYTSLTTKCIICSGNQENADGKLYVNKTTGW